MTVPQTRLGGGASLLAAILLALPGSAFAHELGALKVSASFLPDHTFRIDVALDIDHLPPGLSPLPTLVQRLTGTEAPVPTDVADPVAEFRGRFVGGIRVAFDDSAVDLREAQPVHGNPDLQGTPSGGGRRIFFHLVGAVPAGAHTFTWSQALPLGSYFLTMQSAGEETPTGQWLESGRTSRPLELLFVSEPASMLQVAASYLALGFTHILPGGLDHILFVLGIFLLSLDRRAMIAQVTAFTAAHSITLALSIYGIVSLPPRVVEPLIALSIVAVAVENLLVAEFRVRRLVIVFAFGLLHGMGFAGVLRDLGLPRSQFIPALLAFNVGVEAGQLAVIALAFITVGLWAGKRLWYRSRVCQPASAAIAAVGIYWTVQRLFF